MYYPFAKSHARGASSMLLAASLLFAVPCVSGAAAAKPHKAPAHKPTNAIKGQGQLAGGDGVFGTVYSMQDGFNEEILGGKYSVDSVAGYGGYIHPDADGKLLVLQVAMKNAKPTDNWSGGWQMSAFDQNGQKYDLSVTKLTSDGGKGFSHNLKPGQGLGQPALHDPLLAFFKVPNNARIVKIFINQPRLNKKEDVLRFYIAGATAAEAGKAGDPKNVIAPLPDYARDKSDPSGATALADNIGGKPGSGRVCSAGPYNMTLDSFGDAPAGTKFNGQAPDDGKKFVVAAVTLHNISADEAGMFDFDGQTVQLTDSDDDTYSMLGISKKDSDDEVPEDHKIQPDAQYSLRIFWSVPSDAKLKKLTIQPPYGNRPWDFDLTP